MVEAPTPAPTLPEAAPPETAALGGPAAPPSSPAEAEAAAVVEAASAGYRIGVGDVLDVVVWKNEQLTRSVTVRPDGRISLPLVNDVAASGMTPSELRDVLKTKLSEYVPTPEVSVLVSRVQSFKVSVIGEVQKPGRFDIRGRITVLDALALAGGLTEFASRNKILVLRQDQETTNRIRFNYDDAVSAETEGQPLLLQPGDIVVVP